MSGASVHQVVLPGSFVQVQLQGLKELVNHHRDNGDAVQFDASDVERVDGSAVQFLLAVSRLQTDNTNLEQLVVNAGDVITDALEDMGLGGSVTTVPPKA